jgi:predicted GNAT family acetyltransferase
MYALATTSPAMPPVYPVVPSPLTVQSLALGQEAEVLAFLATRPLHTVIMASMIRDNGLVNPLNRGAFHACRDAAGQLLGVALIGHVTMVETSSDEAVELFAELAQQYQTAHVILGEQDKVSRFWDFYGRSGQSPRLLCRELLLEQRWPVEVLEPVNLRQATLDDLDLIAPVHAQLAFEECGINPMEKDPIGFRQRVAQRIKLGRIWVWIEQGKLIFKADIQSETPEQIYLEGVYTHPEERGKGYGSRCLSQLSRTLLASASSLCVLVNEQNPKAQLFYRKAGYAMRGYYDTIFLQTAH